MSYSLMTILDTSIFQRFNATEKAQEFYYKQLEKLANRNLLYAVCMKLAKSSKNLPTVTDIEQAYNDANTRTYDKSTPILSELQSKEASVAKDTFFSIRKKMLDDKLGYNDACLELLLDSSWYIPA